MQIAAKVRKEPILPDAALCTNDCKGNANLPFELSGRESNGLVKGLHLHLWDDAAMVLT